MFYLQYYTNSFAYYIGWFYLGNDAIFGAENLPNRTTR